MKATVSLAAGCESESHSVISDCLRPHGLYSAWNSPGQNTEVVSLFLLQGIFPTQGSNPGLLHCRWILYHLSHRGSLLGVVMLFILIKRTKADIWERLLFPNKKKIKREKFAVYTTLSFSFLECGCDAWSVATILKIQGQIHKRSRNCW